ncbi:MAG: ATP-binding cassette domain-containing protein [Bacteroidales bacterium]
MNTIECKNIVKEFGTFRALNNVSISVPQGKIFGLLGPNGAGKTTLIRIMNQISLPDQGSVFFNGNLLKGDDVYKIGYLPEERGLYKKMKVGDQALYLAKLKGLNTRQATRELKIWFKKFSIDAWWDKKVEELSKGMAQKIQFITTVLHKPKLLILDEPFAGFDPINVQLIRNEILRMKDEGTTIILSTHNMESVEELCDNIALINKSNLVVTGGVDEIRRKHGKNQVELIYKASEALNFSSSVISDEVFKDYRKAIFNLEKEETTKEAIQKILPEVDHILSVRELIPSMNDIFIELVSKEAK